MTRWINMAPRRKGSPPRDQIWEIKRNILITAVRYSAVEVLMRVTGIIRKESHSIKESHIITSMKKPSSMRLGKESGSTIEISKYRKKRGRFSPSMTKLKSRQTEKAILWTCGRQRVISRRIRTNRWRSRWKRSRIRLPSPNSTRKTLIWMTMSQKHEVVIHMGFQLASSLMRLTTGPSNRRCREMAGPRRNRTSSGRFREIDIRHLGAEEW